MHPHLVQGKQEKCGDLIKALNECHAQGLVARMTGACNDVKMQLTLCLREERLERTARNREAAKEKGAAVKRRWEQLDAERAEAEGRQTKTVPQR